MPTAYELTGWAARLSELVLNTDLTNPDEVGLLHECADAFEGELTDKVAALAWVIEAMADHQAIAGRDLERARRAKGLWVKREASVRNLLEELLVANEAATGATKVSTTYGTASLSKRTEYNYPTDPNAWPPGWVTTETTTTTVLDKAGAKEYLRSPEELPELPGFSMTTRKGLSWRRAGGKVS